MFTILTFLGQALVYCLLTLPRTIGFGGLVLYFLIGGFLFFLRWVLGVAFQSSSLTYSNAIVFSLVEVLSLSLPIYWLLFKSRAGRGTNLMDGIALGAFVGIGYGLNYSLHLLNPFGELSFLSWILGSINSGYPSIVQASHLDVVWGGYAIWGALVGFGLALARVLRVRIQPLFCWMVPALSISLVFLEMLVFNLFLTGLLGQETIWRPISEWFYWLDSSGRQARFFLVLFYLLSFGLGEYLYKSRIPSLTQFLLKSEPRNPTFLSELSTCVLALRKGVLVCTEVSSFFRSRRRLVSLLTEQRWSKREDPQLSQLILRAEDQVAEQTSRAETALAGGTLLMDDNRLSARQTAQRFASGLVLTLVFTGLYLFFIAWLGGSITERLGNDPMGYIYATLIVTAFAYTLAYFRKHIVSRILNSLRSVVKGERPGETGL